MRHDRSRENCGFLNPDNIGFVNIYWESKIIELSDGRLLSAAWVYDKQLKIDRDNHFVITRGAGVDSLFTEPRSWGLKG
jgi:hypothetical protein